MITVVLIKRIVGYRNIATNVNVAERFACRVITMPAPPVVDLTIDVAPTISNHKIVEVVYYVAKGTYHAWLDVDLQVNEQRGVNADWVHSKYTDNGWTLVSDVRAYLAEVATTVD